MSDIIKIDRWKKIGLALGAILITIVLCALVGWVAAALLGGNDRQLSDPTPAGKATLQATDMPAQLAPTAGLTATPMSLTTSTPAPTSTPLPTSTPTNVPPPDRDGDRILDSDDLCPDEPGKASAFGCPDEDEDGVRDSDDVCKTEPGPAEAFGCPDDDGDGVANIYDDCPNEFGTNSNGCPGKPGKPGKSEPEPTKKPDD